MNHRMCPCASDILPSILDMALKANYMYKAFIMQLRMILKTFLKGSWLDVVICQVMSTYKVIYIYTYTDTCCTRYGQKANLHVHMELKDIPSIIHILTEYA